MTEQNEIKDIVEVLYKIMIAVQSLNPDPTQSIAEYRKSRRRKAFWPTYSAIMLTVAVLIGGEQFSSMPSGIDGGSTRRQMGDD
jgi:hypothetical protein